MGIGVGGLLEGARKLTSLECRRRKHRATAAQTRRLAHFAKHDLERADVADSWVVARFMVGCSGVGGAFLVGRWVIWVQWRWVGPGTGWTIVRK